jgi:hypothetical protein
MEIGPPILPHGRRGLTVGHAPAHAATLASIYARSWCGRSLPPCTSASSPPSPLREAAGPLRSHSHAGRSRSRSPAELPPSLLRQLGGCPTRDGGGRPTALLARAPDELCVFRCLLSAEAPTPSLPAADRPRTTIGLAHTDVCGYHARRRLSRSPPAQDPAWRAGVGALVCAAPREGRVS